MILKILVCQNGHGYWDAKLVRTNGTDQSLCNSNPACRTPESAVGSLHKRISAGGHKIDKKEDVTLIDGNPCEVIVRTAGMRGKAHTDSAQR